ncbi:MAG TPA: thiol peroxidase [Anaerolineales bacterium]|nr:thiol peroxidase [Anaerolineales bacterium]
MKNERKGVMNFKGLDITIVGNDMALGDKAPEFTVQNNEFQLYEGLKETNGKVRIIASIPSLETGVCDRETRRFNMEATNLNEEIIVMVISMDLPYTQKRWCGAAGMERVITLSDHMFGDFGEKYGCLIKEARVLRRAAFVIDRMDNIVYTEYMAEMGLEPTYEDIINAAKAAL